MDISPPPLTRQNAFFIADRPRGFLFIFRIIRKINL